MFSPKIREFLEAGVHFGHQTSRWNPKMKPFIFAARNGIYIIDLQKTVNALEHAKNKVREVVRAGRSILFVGTVPISVRSFPRSVLMILPTARANAPPPALCSILPEIKPYFNLFSTRNLAAKGSVIS